MQLIKDTIDLSAYMKDEEAVTVKPASTWMYEVIDHFHNKSVNKYGPRLPWAKCQNDFEFRRGEVTIWAGINGHGKSMLLSQVCLALLIQGEKLCIASLEMKPFRTMSRMCRQAIGNDCPSPRAIKEFGAWTDGRLWLYDKVGHCDPKRIAAVIRYAVDKFGIDHFIVDNLTKVIAGEDNYNDQKDFIDSACAIASDLNIHIHVVLHVRKGPDEDNVPNKMSVKGAGSVTDMADNLFIVWRNKKKERQLREGEMSVVPDPDCILALEKQRNGEIENSYLLWFDRDSMQYVEDRHALPKIYKPFKPENWSQENAPT